MAKIKIYSTPTCPFCRMAKEFFKEKKIVFEDIDVSADRAVASELFERSGHMGVPQIEVNGKIIIGFDKAALEQELKDV